MLKYVPNLLTGLRIVLVPLFIVSFVLDHLPLCAVLFLVSGISDVCDGPIARRYSCESSVGRILDPVADKLTYAAAFFCLYAKGRLPLYFVVCFTVVQLLMGLGALFIYRSGRVVVKSNVFGKINGALMFALCFLSLLLYRSELSSVLTNCLCILVLGANVCALTAYFLQYIVFSSVEKQHKN